MITTAAPSVGSNQVSLGPLIEARSVSKRYSGGVEALSEISTTIGAGEFVFVIGPSGSGKSTLLRLINREETADDGAVLLGGIDVRRLRRWKVPHLRRNVGCIFQDFKLLANRTAADNVAFALRALGTPPREVHDKVPAILALVGLAGKLDRYPRELSGGEQQRVAIARAFVNRPLVLLADEPTGNLDPATTEEIVCLLDRINELGTTVVMATHGQDIVDSRNHRVLELAAGRIVRDDVSGGYLS